MSNLSSVVNIQIDRNTRVPSAQGFGLPLVFGEHNVSGDKLREYSALSFMLDDGFTPLDPVYQAASNLFSQTIRPDRVLIGKREPDALQVVNVLVGGDTDGTYTITINGVPFSYIGDADLPSDIANGLITAINAGDEPVTASSGSGNSLNITSDGPTFTIEITDNPGGHLSLTTTTAGATAVSELRAIQNIRDDWYYLVSTGNTEDDIVTLASYIESQVKLYGYSTDQEDSKTLSDSQDTTSILARLKALGYERSFGTWHNDRFPEAAWGGRVLPQNPGSINWKFRTVAGIAPSTLAQLSATERANVKAKNGNTYVEIGGIPIFEEGVVASGEYIDIIRGTDFIQSRIQEAVFRLLSTEDKVDFTDDGIQQIALQVRSVLNLAVTNRIIQPDFTITVPEEANISAADKGNRILRGLEFQAQYSGAINRVSLVGRLTI